MSLFYSEEDLRREMATIFIIETVISKDYVRIIIL